MNTEWAIHNTSKWGFAISSILDNKIVSLEFASYFLGEFLGNGVSRYVFALRQNPKWVIKIDCSDMNANVLEHSIWQAIQHIPVSKWFAPVKDISRCGRIMMQRRVQTDISSQKYPNKIPSFFTDTKFENWGIMDKRFVCCDYAGVTLNMLGDKKLVTPEWWSINKIVP